jgi:hypothetical protein
MNKLSVICILWGFILVPGSLLAFEIIDGCIIYDASQGLFWMLDANYAQTPENPAGTMTWSMADSFMDSQPYCGFDDWRLPTEKELEGLFQQIVSPEYSNPFLNFCDASTGGFYWTSTPCNSPGCHKLVFIYDNEFGWWVDNEGFFDTELRHAIYVKEADYDSDGIADGLDECPNTPKEATVKSNGCMEGDIDNDGDVDGDDLAKFSHNFGL